MRLPIAIATIEPERKGQQNSLCRQRLKALKPPAWVREVIVVAAAGQPAHAPRKLLTDLQWTQGFALPRTRKFTHGQYGRDCVPYLPQALQRRRATYKPDGTRQAQWGFLRHAVRHQLGDVTSVLAKKRRNSGPKRVKIIVTNLLDVSARAILSPYAVRGGVELTIKELKGGRHVGRMQGTEEADRVERSVVLPVCAYLLFVHVYGQDAAPSKAWSLFQLKQRFTAVFMPDQMQRLEQKWGRKWGKIKEAA